MPRGSNTSGSGGSNINDVESFQSSGMATNSGKATLRKTFITSDQQNLQGADSIQLAGSTYKPTNITWRGLGAGLFEKTVEYESFVPGGNSNGIVEMRNGVEGRFELEYEDHLEPIETHPNLGAIMKKFYGYYESGKLLFYPTIPSSGNSGLGSGSGGSVKNPMFGVKYYNRPKATFRHTQQLQDIPANIWQDVGKKIDKLPAGFPDVPDGVADDGTKIKYSWVVQSPSIYRRGNAYEVIRTYTLNRNAPDELYSTTQAQTK